MPIDPKLIEAWRDRAAYVKALAERASHDARARPPEAMPAAESLAAGALVLADEAVPALLAEREELGRLALRMSRGNGAPGLTICRECGRVAKIEELRAAREPAKLAHFPRCPVAPWEDGRP